MAADSTITLTPRMPEHSRGTRRLRRQGLVPGVIYGGGGDPETFAVDAKVLRNALHATGAVLEVTIEGGKQDNVVVKDLQIHPVRGEVTHVDLLRVRMDVAIHATAHVELVGGEEAPGVKEGGVLTQELREINIEALPGDIPDVITHDVSGAEMQATIHVSELTAPKGVTILDDPESVVATITLPTAEPVEEELETETELVGEDGEVIEGEAEGDTGEEAEQSAADSSEES
jgi:large subunit ribosomal protein L25